MAPGLSEMLIRPIFEAAGMPSETAAYATGTGDHSRLLRAASGLPLAPAVIVLYCVYCTV